MRLWHEISLQCRSLSLRDLSGDKNVENKKNTKWVPNSRVLFVRGAVGSGSSSASTLTWIICNSPFTKLILCYTHRECSSEGAMVAGARREEEKQVRNRH